MVCVFFSNETQQQQLQRKEKVRKITIALYKIDLICSWIMHTNEEDGREKKKNTHTQIKICDDRRIALVNWKLSNGSVMTTAIMYVCQYKCASKLMNAAL